MSQDCAACSAGPRSQRFFIDAAEPNCLSCQILTQSLRQFFPPEGPRSKVRLILDFFEDGSPLAQVASADEDDEPTGLTYYVKSTEDAQHIARHVGNFFRRLAVGYEVERFPSGNSSLSRISAWDSHCRLSHAKCQPRMSPLPSRVIDVRITDGKCRLYESKREDALYMTLSHCWGKLEILTTTKANLATHRNAIDLKALPKSFQDAIAMTAKLGIQYLWIDSLCIVQDDAKDWAKESSMMASIYSNSYLTLAASAAVDGSEGLFKERNVEVYSYDVPVPGQPDPIAVHCTVRKRHDCFRAEEDFAEASSESNLPLLTRAWVFQERLLSPRILHFASDELVWECRQTTNCECGHTPDYWQFEENQRLHGDKFAPDTPDRVLFQELNREKHWFRLIRSYTRLQITKDDDRLPAFSGIASTLVEANDYLAGLRRAHLIGDLLWSTTLSQQSRRPRSYQAPSWSWASVMAHIIHPTTGPHNWDTGRPSVLAQVKSASTTPSTTDPYGRVNGGQLCISGSYFEADILRKDESELIGSTFGRHCLRAEIAALPAFLWPTELMFDTTDDARLALDAPVTLLAVLEELGHVHFLILASAPNDQTKMRRLGMTTLIPFMRGEKVQRVAVQDILSGAKVGEFTII